MPDRNRRGCPPLPLETLYNARDLGGFPIGGGRTTACGRFLRADAPVRLSIADQTRCSPTRSASLSICAAAARSVTCLTS